MITGHTHELKLYEENNILYLNPGSLTGARTVVNTGKKEHIPSFMLLDVNQNNIVIYIYKLINDKGNIRIHQYFTSEIADNFYFEKICPVIFRHINSGN